MHGFPRLPAAILALGILALGTLAGPAASSAQTAGGGSDAEQRIQHLEEQMVDLQVVTGTLESLARGGTPSGGRTTSGAGGDLDGRLSALETQIRALAGQLSQMSADIEALKSGRAGSLRSGSASLGDAGTSLGGSSAGGGSEPLDAGSGGGWSTGLDTPTEGASGSDAGLGGGIASLGGGDTPEQAYEEAYGYVLQQDYVSAEQAFRDFLGRYPKSQLAGNAQYWLGETYYVRGQYKEAADAFLTGYKSYRKGQKAPESLLRLAMSLNRLNQSKTACTALQALASEFPDAPARVRQTADKERSRAGC